MPQEQIMLEPLVGNSSVAGPLDGQQFNSDQQLPLQYCQSQSKTIVDASVVPRQRQQQPVAGLVG